MDNVTSKNPVDIDGETPLHQASTKGHADICKLILDSIDDKNPANHRGKTPLDMAEKYGHADICELIRNSMMMEL